MSKVLLVTDYAGGLHITPVANKDFYQSRNNAVKDKQFKFKEMAEDEAYKFVEKNSGIDPDFKAPKQINKVIEDKDAEIRELRAALAAAKKDPEVQEQRAILNELSTTPTSNSEYSQAAAEQIKETPGAKAKGK
ncbi:hypothetical protein [Segetibacter aerophilus]|uniref:Uncharacterized protein n=1 Tax=Segetibacter aerophilus TaxID=670293 RepID=A0A512B9Z6_9BACT|nr:hypothetical protein [Segetibacter aerophilus]GEO08769.1 hypothetical protein SAE01_12650 [Segetibacter aerophilus]